MADTVTVTLTTNAVTVTETVNTVTVAPVANTVTVASVGTQGIQGPTGADGVTVESVAFVSDDMVFTLTDASTVPLVGAKTALKGDKGDKGDTGPAGADGEGSGDVIGPAGATDGHIALFDTGTGKLLKDAGVAPYSLPTAAADTLGGVKVGTGLSITDGVLSATGGSGTDEATVNSLVFAQTY